ncbi:hypothetical protein HMPREF9347_05649 [Escherichia coli MS 124-1]|uniref:Uncharacterized protein n=1 Tax=Escherichia coli MS 85-1 TaxID=679202 RepID=A0AAN3M4M2_ECOLX|nr:hypothetical protein HMPREF9536_00288 [Escherichia coli MS 84-1]EFK65505.1 hypothetical protein HMPREF9347_05649 [Escherichia coli MS 124-1]EFU32455.1 hypothetical protein HMPREF9350_05712 [Escherichia coli MS 85-1]
MFRYTQPTTRPARGCADVLWLAYGVDGISEKPRQNGKIR